MRGWEIKIATLIIMGMLAACSLAPEYHRPEMKIPSGYKETGKWVPAKPDYADAKRGPWWKMFGDRELNILEEKVSRANQNLKLAQARYMEARAAAAVARSAYFPTVSGIGNVDRQQISGNIANKSYPSLYSDMLIGAGLSYELDVWGRVRNAVAASEDRAQASAADLAAIDLSLHAELASDYFSLRAVDKSQHVLDNVVVAYRKALEIVRRRHADGLVPEANLDQAKTQYENAKTLATDMHLKHDQLEHAIAVLIGEAPAFFTLKPVPYKAKFVSISPYLASTLLERRPDIAAAERRVMAANAEIGVARASFFPDFNLVAAGGLESATFPKLFTMPSLFWSLGPGSALVLLEPTASLVLADGGKLQGLLDEAKAGYYQTVDLYRQAVLTAYREVEDNLAAQRQLKKEHITQTAATAAANSALTQAQYRYYGGLTTYLEVVVAQNIALQSELASININTRRQIASVQLIQALGGGWEEPIKTREFDNMS